MKKAFTIIELIFVIVFMGILAYYAAIQTYQTRFNLGVSDFAKQLDSIIDTAILHPVTGYANGTAGSCSNDYYFKDISAYRVNDCSKLNMSVSGNIPMDGTKNYLTVLNEFATDGRMYIDDLNGDDTKFYIFLNLSSISNERKRLYAEDYLESNIKKYYQKNLDTFYRNATTINDQTESGGVNDGKVGFILHK